MNELLTPQSITSAEYENVKAAFDTETASVESREALFAEWKKYFEAHPEQLYQYRHTYGTWFTLLFMRVFQSLAIEDIAWGYGHVGLMATLLEFDLEDPLFYYIEAKSQLGSDQEYMYGVVRTAFLNPYGNYGMGKDGQPLGMKQLQQQLIKMYRDDASSYDRTQLILELKKQIEAYYFKPESIGIPVLFVDPKEAIDTYDDMLNIFQLYDKDHAGDLVLYHNTQDWFVETSSTSPVASTEVTGVDAEGEPMESNSNFVTIQQFVSAQFGDITTMSPTDITPVLTYLSQQAEEQHNPKINELIYFDTASETFQWNEDLLKPSTAA